MKGTREIIDGLLAEGFTTSDGHVRYLLRERVLPMPDQRGPAGVLIWSPADVDRLKSILRRRGRGPCPSRRPP